MLNIFLSSTYRDLSDPRLKIINRLDTVFEGVGMEKFIPDGSNSQEVCISNLKESDIVIFIISSYYGSLIENCSLKEECKAECPMKTGEGKVSFTHCEYKNAIAERKLHQTYLVLEDWNATDIPKEALSFKEEIGNEMWKGIGKVEDPNTVNLITSHLAENIIKWHYQDKLEFKNFCDREAVLHKLIENIDKKLEIWGIGGVGKTALIEVALLIQKLRGKKIIKIGIPKAYASGSGFLDFRVKCKEDQYITEFRDMITIYDVINAFAHKGLLFNGEEIRKMNTEKQIIELSNYIRETQDLVLFIDDFHLASEEVVKMTKALDHIILSSKKNTGIANIELYLSGIDEEDRDQLIELFSTQIPKDVRKLICKIAEGHPVSTEILVKNYQNINFDKLKDFDLADANDTQVNDFYKRVIEEIYTDNPEALNLLKNIAVLNLDLPTNIHKESVLAAFNFEDSRKTFRALIDTGMLRKRKGKEDTYEFYFKHIQDYLEDEAKHNNHEKAINYYKKKRYFLKQAYNVDDDIELLYHKIKSNPSERLVNEFLELKEKIYPVNYGFKRLITIGEQLKTLVKENDKAKMFLELGDLYYDLNKFTEAEVLLLDALKGYETLVKQDPDNLSAQIKTQNLLGLLYNNIKRFEEAELIYNNALDILESLTDKRKENCLADIAMTQQNMGVLYDDLKRHEEAESFLLDSLNGFKLLTEKNPITYLSDVADTQHILGLIYNNLKRFEDAEKMYQEALNIRKSLAEKEPDAFLSELADTKNNLGVLYNDLNRFEDAEEMYCEALKIRNILVKKNPDSYLSDLAMSKQNLGLLYDDLKRFDEAETLLIGALESYENLAEQNPAVHLSDIADIQNNLGALYWNIGKYEEAERMYLNALNTYEKLVKQNPGIYLSDLAMIQYNLGELYTDLKRFDKAEFMLLKALDIHKKLAVSNPDIFLSDVAMNQHNLGELYMNLKRYKQAEDALLESLSIRRLLAEESPEAYLKDVSVTKNKLGLLYIHLKRFKEAEIMLHDAFNIRKFLAKKCPDVYLNDVSNSLSNLGLVYEKLGKLQEIEQLYNEELNLNPYNSIIWYNKACLESLKNNIDKVIEYLKKAIEIDEKHINSAKWDKHFEKVRTLKKFKDLIENDIKS